MAGGEKEKTKRKRKATMPPVKDKIKILKKARESPQDVDDEDEQKHQKVVKQITTETRDMRNSQRMTKILKKKDEMNKLVLSGIIDAETADDAVQSYTNRLDNEEAAKDQVILIGKNVMPTNKSQIVTSVNPFELSDEMIVNVGRQPDMAKVVYAAVRFDDNYIISVEEVKLPPKTMGYSQAAFPAWSIKRLKKGEIEGGINESGARTKPFNFSGRLSTLPELHCALKKIAISCVTKKLPSVDDALKNGVDKTGAYDLSGFAYSIYTAAVMRFGEFAAYHEYSTYKSNTQQLVTYPSLTLAKEKSEAAKKKSKPGAPAFFCMKVPIRVIDTLILAAEMLMALNKMPTSVIDAGDIEDGEFENLFRNEEEIISFIETFFRTRKG